MLYTGLTQEGVGPRIERLCKTEKQLFVGWGCWDGKVGDSVQLGVSSGLQGEVDIRRGGWEREGR